MRTYVISIDGEEHVCPNIEKLAEVIFDNGAESEEMCDEFWSKDVDQNLSLEAKDAMLRHRFHGSSVLVDALARHILNLYVRAIRSHLQDLESGKVEAVEWENGDCGTVSVYLEDDE